MRIEMGRKVFFVASSGLLATNATRRTAPVRAVTDRRELRRTSLADRHPLLHRCLQPQQRCVSQRVHRRKFDAYRFLENKAATNIAQKSDTTPHHTTRHDTAHAENIACLTMMKSALCRESSTFSRPAADVIFRVHDGYGRPKFPRRD